MVRGVIITVNTVLSGNKISQDGSVFLSHLIAHDIPCGLVSFKNTQQERDRLIVSGIDSFVSFRVFESSPERAFEQAFDRLARSPGDVMVIARNDENILQANRLNCISVKVDRRGVSHPTPVVGDTPSYVVRSLEEIVPLIP